MASAAEQLAANMNFGAFQKATELHKRIWFTLLAMVVYRLGTYIPIPGINAGAFAHAFEGQSKGILGMFNMFSGGAVQRMAVFSLNVMPYISSSIIVQLLQTTYPPWEKLRKEGGEAGRKQLNQYTRYLTVLLAIFQSFGIGAGLSNSPGIVDHPGIFFIISTMVSLTGGTMFLMWLGEQMTSRGVGNGISLIIFAGIVARLPVGLWNMLQDARQDSSKSLLILAYIVLAVVVVLFIVFMERAQRRLLIVYPKRQVGNRMTGGENSFLPLEDQRVGRHPADLRFVAVAAADDGARLSIECEAAELAELAAAGRRAAHSRKAAVHAALWRADHFLLLLLHLGRLQSGRHGGEPAQVRRQPAGYSSGQADGGIYRFRTDTPDHDRRHLHRRGVPGAGIPGRRERILCLRRHFDPDRRVGDHGHGGPNPVTSPGPSI